MCTSPVVEVIVSLIFVAYGVVIGALWGEKIRKFFGL